LVFFIVSISIGLFLLNQWSGAALILLGSLGIFIGIKNTAKTKANNAVRRKMFLCPFIIEVSSEEMTLTKSKSILRLHFSDMITIDEGDDFFYFEHILGYVFFIPKNKLDETSVQTIKRKVKGA
jgi:hypothetical protein